MEAQGPAGQVEDTRTTDEGTEVPDHRARAALVYVPGLDLGLTSGKSAVGVATRLQRACDRETGAKFRVHWDEGAVSATPAQQQPTLEPIATVFRHEKGAESPAFDVYEYRWAGSLSEGWESQSVIRKGIRVLIRLFRIPSFLRYFNTAGKKNPFGRLQLALAFLIVLVVLAYAALVIVAAGQAIYQAYDARTTDNASTTTTSVAPPENPEESSSSDSEPEPADSQGITPVQWIVLVATPLAALAPKWRRLLTTAGASLFAADGYIRLGDGRGALTGPLVDEVDALRAEPRHKDQDIAFVSYSFGAVLALDTLFPPSGGREQALSRVGKLVTIGAPFDFVRAADLSYFDGRESEPSLEWKNIYSPVDLMGSNFRNDVEEPDAELGVSMSSGAAVAKPSDNQCYDTGIDVDWGNLLEFHGFLSHGTYWGKDEQRDRDVFRFVVQFLYEGDPILA